VFSQHQYRCYDRWIYSGDSEIEAAARPGVMMNLSHISRCSVSSTTHVHRPVRSRRRAISPRAAVDSTTRPVPATPDLQVCNAHITPLSCFMALNLRWSSCACAPVHAGCQCRSCLRPQHAWITQQCVVCSANSVTLCSRTSMSAGIYGRWV